MSDDYRQDLEEGSTSLGFGKSWRKGFTSKMVRFHFKTGEVEIKWTFGKDDIAGSRADLRRPYGVYSSLDGGHSAPRADAERQDTAGKPSSTYGPDPRPPIFYAKSSRRSSA